MITVLQRTAARELFESTARKNDWLNELYELERVDNGAYLDLYLELRWQGWVAAIEETYGDS